MVSDIGIIRKCTMNHKISRRKFIGIGNLVLLGSLIPEFVHASDTFLSETKNSDQLMQKLIASNDNSVKKILDEGLLNINIRLNSYRSLASKIAILSAAFSCPQSNYYRSEIIVQHLNVAIDIMLKGQYNDGTVDAGGNRQSPPDTAFVLENICAATAVLTNTDNNTTLSVRKNLKKFILNAGKAMLTGGVHTPNHRWVICAALANINTLYPDAKYVRRIDEWLSEGIYLNEDGHYSERSGVYSAVINRAFITMAILLQRPELLNVVHKNLTTYYYYTEPNGDLISIDSRRQDQLTTLTVTPFYLQYRYMAIHTKDPLFTYMVRTIESLPDFEEKILSHSLILFMENSELQKELPVLKNNPHEFEKFFVASNLARIRHENTSVTLFGGTDKPVKIISGRSSNPNFITFAKGNAILNYMRLSTSFFRMGYFRSNGLEKIGQTYRFTETKEAYYYQPMPVISRKTDGDYKLSASPDGRFWNKMDFDAREKSNIKTQTTVIEITENNGVLQLEIKVDGPPNVEVTLEMCFKEGGKLTGTESLGNNNYMLKSDPGTYVFGGDTIEFGPGKKEHQRIDNLASEQYGYHQGSLRTDGMHVFLTGYTPFRHKMTLG